MKVKKITNYETFLKIKTAAYKGKWIAIAQNRVVATSSRADLAFKLAKKKHPRSQISLAKVPREETMVLEHDCLQLQNYF